MKQNLSQIQYEQLAREQFLQPAERNSVCFGYRGVFGKEECTVGGFQGKGVFGGQR